ncbi:hypothetical protein Clacol_007093 [Clathrus columnatus]|uniref:Autophagy-related protein 13 n=1 Tax=Clathrus columnatus TaxID=1419009 RepID=A0AAV5AIB6_9AGAM|nr:hypothetical protein Clacol_007093 [Clathrus columnatus]
MSSETWLKADQITHKFFSKLALLVYNARSSTIDSHKVDKWFNLETPDTDIFKNHLRVYRTISTLTSPLPPFELQVLLAVPDLANNQVLVLTDPSSARRTHVRPTPSHVLLESWVVLFTPSTSRSSLSSPSASSSTTISNSEEIALSSVYKQSISLFRSLYTLLRILPAYKLSKRLKRAGADSSQLSIQVRVHTQPSQARLEKVLNFGDAISPPSPIPSPSPMPTRTQLPQSNTSNIPQFSTNNTSISPLASLPTSSHTFPSVSHPLGTLSITVTYLLSPTFHIDTLESLLSSRFLSQSRDEEAFVPTIAARQAQGQSGSLRSMGGIPNASRSPPRQPLPSLMPAGTGFGQPSLADRFILPPGGSVSSVRSNTSRPVSLLSSGSAGSGHGEGALVPVLPTTTQTNTAGTSALPIRRPSISVNPLINPFKSPTLSSTSAPHSLHSQYSPHSIHSQYSTHSSGAVIGAAIEHGPTLPSRPPSTLSTQQHPFPSQSQVPPSPSLRHPSGGSLTGLGVSSSPAGTGTLGSSPASASSQTGQQSVGPRKYVSSFSHRRQSSALGSVDKGETPPIPASPSNSGLALPASNSKEGSDAAKSSTSNTNPPDNGASSSPFSAMTLDEADEDELSAFVQAIDERVPLGSVRGRLRSGGPGHPLREGSSKDREEIQEKETTRQREGSERTVRKESSSPSVSPRSPLSPSTSTPPSHLNPLQSRLPSQTTETPSNQQLTRNVPRQTYTSGTGRFPQSRAAIDAELKRMNDAFMTSLSTLNFNTGISSGAGATGVIRRRTASGVSSGSPSPGQSGTSALGLARRVSLAGGSPSGSIGSSSASGSPSGLVSGPGSGTGSPLGRSPSRGGYRPLYPPLPPSGSSGVLAGINTTSSSPTSLNSASASPSNLRPPNPLIYQYSSAPSSHTHHPIPAHPHPHSVRQPHQGSPLRSAIPLDESSSSSPSPIERGNEGDADSGSGELGSGYNPNPPTRTGLGGIGASPPRPRPMALGGTASGQGSSASPQIGLMRRILARANTSEEVIGRLEVSDDIGNSNNGSGGSGDIRGVGVGGRPSLPSKDQVVYPFPGREETDKGGRRGNGYMIL